SRRPSNLAAGLSPPPGRPSSLLDTRVIYSGDCREQLKKLPDRCIDLIDPVVRRSNNPSTRTAVREQQES
ncbi:MAG TPA: hypothetical protein VJ837_02455, partial [Candidatus Paceibacterota bacterium]|nr:hypothetical protein [Candidatus Paceibacterota bacterium]